MTDAKEKAQHLLAEAERGRSERTPWLLIGGMQIVVLVIVAVVLAIVFTVYLLA
jgi:hypothetical protein